MSARLADVLDIEQLDAMLASGHIRARVHPDDESLTIYNYAEKAQYEKVWTHETKTCRGLIVRDGEVLARPWPKFFNHGEFADGSLDLSAPVEVTDKADGSLGILYPAPDGWAIATRGSFQSEQAIHATALFRERYAPKWAPGPGWTFLFEIVYPENRIVLDYKGADDLILLGAVRISDGARVGPSENLAWPGPNTTLFPASTLAEALALPPRENAEGLVVRYTAAGGPMVKIKQEDYVRLHKLVTGLSERAVWEHLAAHGNYDQMLEAVPDEFHGWVNEQGDRLIESHDVVMGRAHASYHWLVDLLGDSFERGDFARRASQEEDRALLFLLLDGKDISPAIWKALKPFGSNPMKHISEDVA